MTLREREVYKEGLVKEMRFNKNGMGITFSDIAKRLGCHRTTVERKFDTPELFTVEEFGVIARMLKLNPSTITHFIIGDYK